MNVHNILFKILIVLKYLVVTKLVPLIRDSVSTVIRMLSNPLAAYILSIMILAKTSKILPNQIKPMLDMYLGFVDGHHLLYVLLFSKSSFCFLSLYPFSPWTKLQRTL